MQVTKSSQLEFIALMASLMSVVALAIDAVLPALDVIGIDIGTTKLVDNQLLITMIFVGLGVGPLFFGPVSDSKGRKPIVFIGFAIFILASFICVSAKSLEWMIVGRILQGVGLSAPRTIAIAIIRDLYSGDYMARIMSFITVVFILVPIVAPLLGKFALEYYDWTGIFYMQIVMSLLVAFWFWKRQRETLLEENRIAFTKEVFINGFKEVIKQKRTIGFTLISGFIVGSFLVFLSSAQQIFQVQYGFKEEFPYIFAALAGSIGISVFLNGNIVLRFGTERLVTVSMISFFVVSLLYVLLFYGEANPPLFILMIFMSLQFFSIGFIFGNLRAMAMEPVGHVAGIAAAITGFIATMMAVPISTYIGSFVSETVFPLFFGFLICISIGLLILLFLKLQRNRVLNK